MKNLELHAKDNNNQDIAVIYQAYGRQGWEDFDKRFFDSYKTHYAGVNHKLVIAAKCYDKNPEGYAALKSYAQQNNAEILDLPDDGMEFAAFYRAAKQLDYKYIFCFVSSAYVLKDNWLRLFSDAAETNENCKLFGPTGSWETILPGIFTRVNRFINKFKKSADKPVNLLPAEYKRPKIKFSQVIRAIFSPLPFPNPHIRTSAFFIEREIYIQYIEKYGFPNNKYEAMHFESGHNGLTNFIVKKGFDIAVVGADGKVYNPKDWDKSNTFRQGNLENAVIGDKSRDYLKFDTQTKRFFEKLSWGKTFTSNNVLFFCQGFHIGDFIWATSAFAVLKKTYPQIRITVIAPKEIKELTDNNPVIDNIIYGLYYENSLKYKIKNLLNFIKIVPQIFWGDFDDCIILFRSRAAILLAKICRIPNIVGGNLYYRTVDYAAEPLAKYYSHTSELYDVHVATAFQTIVKSYYNIYNNSIPVIPDIKTKSGYSQSLIKRKDKINIAICITKEKNIDEIIPVADFAEAINHLSEKFNQGIDFYTIGSKKDSATATLLAETAAKSSFFNLCGKTTLLELTAFLKGIDCLISVDTGVVHLAATQNIPIITLYGRKYPPKRITPMTNKAYALYSKDTKIDAKYIIDTIESIFKNRIN
ncbi:MAG: hypothetical protein FWF32_06475 [Endomicrobia bacterium]|nr:hypothetical protein [Endomicrobiia bacterium]